MLCPIWEDNMTLEVKKDEDWMQKKWRPMMGWMYMVVCMFDMVIFPILWAIIQTSVHQSLTQWNPLTLQGAGLFHIAMGAVLGISAFGRTQEKLAGTAVTSTSPIFQAPTVFPSTVSASINSFPGDPLVRNTRND